MAVTGHRADVENASVTQATTSTTLADGWTFFFPFPHKVSFKFHLYHLATATAALLALFFWLQVINVF